MDTDREILVNILRTIGYGKRPSPSQYRNLSLLELKNYIYALEKNELVKKHNEDSDVYIITVKGVRYLTEYDRVIELLCSKSRKREQILVHAH